MLIHEFSHNSLLKPKSELRQWKGLHFFYPYPSSLLYLETTVDNNGLNNMNTVHYPAECFHPLTYTKITFCAHNEISIYFHLILSAVLCAAPYNDVEQTELSEGFLPASAPPVLPVPLLLASLSNILPGFPPRHRCVRAEASSVSGKCRYSGP